MHRKDGAKWVGGFGCVDVIALLLLGWKRWRWVSDTDSIRGHQTKLHQVSGSCTGAVCDVLLDVAVSDSLST